MQHQYIAASVDQDKLSTYTARYENTEMYFSILFSFTAFCGIPYTPLIKFPSGRARKTYDFWQNVDITLFT